MFYLIGGLIGLFFYAFYLALMAVVWAIGILITGVGMLVVALIEYFSDKKLKVKPPMYAKYYKQFEVKK